ncbi:MAG TPA: N-acetylmuramoyl-L-alanine amidase [Jatrophihabitans sp.]|nr:N-acetylmuramoyl-L-alanine amidase [Jatrophihabitans sp.]
MLRRSVAVLALLAIGCAGCDSAGGTQDAASSPPVSVSSPPPTVPASSTAPLSSTLPTTPRSSSVRRTPRPSSSHRHRSPSPTHKSTPRRDTVALPPVAGGSPVVVLNPGHNGGNGSHPVQINRQVPAGYGNYKACDTTGTTTNAGYSEHAFNWDVSLRVRRILQGRGVRVILTRPSDDGVGPCVDERAAIGNRRGVAAVVSIHADGAPSAGHGFHVNQDARRPDGATAATAARSIELGRDIHAALQRSSGLVPSTYIGQDGYYFRTDLAGLNLATNPATFLELGNMRNAGDAALQSSGAGRQRIALAIAAGILAYLNR